MGGIVALSLFAIYLISHVLRGEGKRSATVCKNERSYDNVSDNAQAFWLTRNWLLF